jgi:DNA-binding response OmpR family regulator
MTKRVLVVDDEVATVKMVQLALEGEGLDVTTATNGAECLLQVNASRPDLVILDVTMPVLDGFETLRALRQHEGTKDLPVIMLTARAADEDVLRGWSTGVDLYLTKPFTIEELLTATRRMLVATETPAGNDG